MTAHSTPAPSLSRRDRGLALYHVRHANNLGRVLDVPYHPQHPPLSLHHQGRPEPPDTAGCVPSHLQSRGQHPTARYSPSSPKWTVCILVQTVAISSDSWRIVSISVDNTVRIWDAIRGAERWSSSGAIRTRQVPSPSVNAVNLTSRPITGPSCQRLWGWCCPGMVSGIRDRAAGGVTPREGRISITLPSFPLGHKLEPVPYNPRPASQVNYNPLSEQLVNLHYSP